MNRWILLWSVAAGLAACSTQDGPDYQLSGGQSSTETDTSSDTSADGGDMGMDDDGDMRFDLANDDGAQGGCEQVHYSGLALPPNVMLTLDRSTSMNNGTRWDDLVYATVAIIDEVGDRARFGARMYPSPVLPDACSEGAVDVEIGPGEAVKKLVYKNTPDGATPTYPGVKDSVQHLLDTIDSQGADRPSVHILIADGAASECGDASQVEDELARLYNGGAAPSVPTYVVAVGGVTHENFDQWAAAGGTQTHIGTSNLFELRNTIRDLVSDVITCTVPLGFVPLDHDGIEVDVDGERATFLGGPAECGDGYYYTSPDHDTIQFCGEICETVRGGAAVDVTFTCPTE